MKEKIISIAVKECSYHELPEEDRALIDIAKDSTKGAYAPYSHFHVGAALLLENGEIVTGANQENAAFSSGTCAERSACFYAGSQYPGVRMKKIAIAAWTRLHHDSQDSFDECFQSHPISPCGACRQALLEYEALYGDIEVLLYGKDVVYKLPSIRSLLPLSFTEF